MQILNDITSTWRKFHIILVVIYLQTGLLQTGIYLQTGKHISKLT